MAEPQAYGSKVPYIPYPSTMTDSKVTPLPGDLGVAPARVSDCLPVVGTHWPVMVRLSEAWNSAEGLARGS